MPKKMTLQERIEDNPNADSIKDYTCYDCIDWYKCPFAFDHYNTNGDCLAEK